MLQAVTLDFWMNSWEVQRKLTLLTEKLQRKHRDYSIMFSTDKEEASSQISFRWIILQRSTINIVIRDSKCVRDCIPDYSFGDSKKLHSSSPPFDNEIKTHHSRNTFVKMWQEQQEQKEMNLESSIKTEDRTVTSRWYNIEIETTTKTNVKGQCIKAAEKENKKTLWYWKLVSKRVRLPFFKRRKGKSKDR